MKAVQNLIFGILVCLSFFSCKEKETGSKTEVQAKIKVEMVTSYGTIILELSNETPLHRDNFIKLVNEKAYDSLLFHRVIEGFMIQGGDPDSKNALPDVQLGEGDLGYTVKSEFPPDLFHKKGALATAREDNQDRASSAIQFFIVQGKTYNDSLLDEAEITINKRLARYHLINDAAYTNLWDSLQKAMKEENNEQYSFYSDRIDTIAKSYTKFERYVTPKSHRDVYKTLGGTPTLDRNYTVFGEVVKGIEVVDSIASTKTNESNRPIKDVRIISVQLLN
jgi:cyclophilin family peptidyl-prolyl cis-trans isomerase